MKLLAQGVKDVPTQRAVRQLEAAVNEIRGAVVVTGSTDTEKLSSLIAALAQLGLITDRTS